MTMLRFCRNAACAILLLAGGSAVAGEQVVVDAAGRSVTMADPVVRLATVGSVPVLNSFVMALGQADALVNTLPPPWRDRPRYRYHAVFAPHLVGLPVIQDPNRAPDLETILAIRPDAVVTTYRSSVDALETHGVPVALLELRRPEDVKDCIALVGRMLGVPEAAARYAAFFDRAVERVRARTAGLAAADKPSVLYVDPATMTQPHLIAEWWIAAAGGRSVTDDGRSTEVLAFSTEEVVGWDPDIFVVASGPHREKLVQHAILGQMRAVREGRVLVLPTGAHTWGNRTSEQPLTVLWAAKHLHPKLFEDLDLVAEVRAFYAEFFRTRLSAGQVADILGGVGD